MQTTPAAHRPVAVADNLPRIAARWADAASVCIILLLCIGVGAATIRADNFFLGDDLGLVHHLHDLSLRRFASYFFADWTEGIYGAGLDELRPLLALTYWLDAFLYGPTGVAGYHATNVLLHMLNGLLVFGLARSVAPGQQAVSLLAASLFVLLPSHAQPVAWISGRVDSLAAAFYLGAFLCFIQFRLRQRRAWLAASVALFVADLYAKQTAITFSVAILAYEAVFWGPAFRHLGRRALRSRYAPHAPFWVLTIAYLVLRHVLFGNALREQLLSPRLVVSFVIRQPFYAAQLVPAPSATSAVTFALAAAFTAVALAGYVWLLVRRPAVDGALIRRLLFFGPVWYAITIAPMAMTYGSARHLYLTTAGLSIALASLILPDGLRGPSRARNLRIAAATTILVLYGTALTSNIRPWIANGVDSGQITSALSSVVRSLPHGSVVLVDIPAAREDRSFWALELPTLLKRRFLHQDHTWFWSWALPFALQTPFVPEDLYAQFAIVERPSVYCCPATEWYAAKRDILARLVHSDGPREVTYVGLAPDNPGTLVRTARTLSGPALRLQVEAALGASLDARKEDITSTEADQVAQILFDAAR
jgi:hypothetical protein